MSQNNAIIAFEIEEGRTVDLPRQVQAEPNPAPTAVPAAVPGGGQSRSARRRAKKRAARATAEKSGTSYPEVPPLASREPQQGEAEKTKVAVVSEPAGKKKSAPSRVGDVKQKEKPKSRPDNGDVGLNAVYSYKVTVGNGKSYYLFTKLMPRPEWQIGVKAGKAEEVIKQVELADVRPLTMIKGDRRVWVGPTPTELTHTPPVDAGAWTRLIKTVAPPAGADSMAALLQSKTGVEALAALQAAIIPTSMLGPNYQLQSTGSNGRYELRLPFLPASGKDVARLLESAFPGVTVALGRVPSSMFATLAAGAAKLYTNTHNVSMFYRTCPSWAQGKHLALGSARTTLEPSWGKNVNLGGGPTVLDEVRASGGPKTMCRHDPLSCDCVSRDPSKLTMMFGMSQTDPPSPKQVGLWCQRWGCVVAIIPNQAFAQWQVRVSRYWRTFFLPGDHEPVALPVKNWYGFDRETKFWSWRDFHWKKLTWTKTPLGAAFVLVEFRLDQLPLTPITAGAINFASFMPVTMTLAEEVYLSLGGEPTARLSIVERAALHLAGRPLTNEAWNTLERTAARLVSESPGQLVMHEEARAAAEIAWVDARRVRTEWTVFGYFRELITPFHDWHTHGKTKLSDLLFVGAATVGALALVGLKPRIMAQATGSVTMPQRLQDPTTVGTLVAATYVVCVAPPVEEYVKKQLGLPGVLGIVGLELYGAFINQGSAGLYRQASTAVMHFAWWKAGMWWGTLCHSAYNFVAMAPVLAKVFELTELFERLAPPGWHSGELSDAWVQLPKSGNVVGALVDTDWWYGLLLWLEGYSTPGWSICGACAADDGSPMVVDSTPSIEVRVPKVQVECQRRPWVELLGPGLVAAVPLVYRSCIHNEIAALRLRLGQQLLWFDESVTLNWAQLHHDLRNDPQLRSQYWDRMLDEVRPGPVVPTPFDEWNASYPSGQRLVNAQAREQARTSGVVGRERMIESFIKVERQPVFVALEKSGILKGPISKPVKPRLIQGRDPVVTASSGPTFHALGKLLRRVWPLEEVSRISYASGTTAEVLGIWYAMAVSRGLRPWPTDVNMWDASVGPGPHMSERADLLALGVNDATRKVLEERETGRLGRTKHGVTYKLRWQVCSGDGDTSFGNSLANGKMWLGLLRHFPTAMVAVNGDNALPMMPEGVDNEDMAMIISGFRSYGFDVRLESDQHSVFDGEICSGRLWAIGSDEYVYGPKIGRVLAKTFWAIDPPRRPLLRKAWIRGIALGLRRDTAFVPVLRVVMSKLINETSDVPASSVPSDPDEPWKLHAALEHQCAETTMRQFCYLYSCQRSQLDELEAWIAGLPTLIGTKLDHPLLTRIAEVDLV